MWRGRIRPRDVKIYTHCTLEQLLNQSRTLYGLSPESRVTVLSVMSRVHSRPPRVRASFRHISPCTRCASRDCHGRGGEGVARDRAGPHHMTRREPRLHFHPPPPLWGCTTALAGARLRLSRAYLAGGVDHDAADAGGAAAGFDFGDAARMAAEFAPILGAPPPRRAASPLGCARAHAHAHSCSHVEEEEETHFFSSSSCLTKSK
jgi:hypothetical protein